MILRRFTFIMGIVFTAIGILGFVPGLLANPPLHDPTLGITAFHGYLFGLFPVNVIHNLIHIVFGVWALIASKNIQTSQVFCKANAVIYAVLAVFGIMPVLNTMFGTVPIHGHDVWLHALIAIATGYFGFAWNPNRDTLFKRHAHI